MRRLADLPAGVEGIVFDLAEPAAIDAALAGIGPVRRLVLVAIDRDANSIADYRIERAIRLVTLKLVGFTEVIVRAPRAADGRCLARAVRGHGEGAAVSRLDDGLTVNGGIVGLTRTLVEELKPLRVNSIHPGIVGDSPFWAEKPAAVENYRSQTPTGRLACMDDIVGATVFLLENHAVNGVELIVDGGWHCR